MEMIHLKINGIPVEVPAGSTVLEAAKAANVDIPTLCYLKDINCIGACRICVVEITGARGLVAACTHPASEGMEVFTMPTPKYFWMNPLVQHLPFDMVAGYIGAMKGGVAYRGDDERYNSEICTQRLKEGTEIVII